MSILQAPCLLMNKKWESIRVESVRDAVTRTSKGCSKILDTETFILYPWEEWAELKVQEKYEKNKRFIRTKDEPVMAPYITILTDYIGVPKDDVRLTKRNLMIRDGFCCQYTGDRLSYKDASLDHVIPRSRGGRNTWENLVISGKTVNMQKGDRTPKQAGLQLRKKPVKPAWNPLYTRYLKKIPSCWIQFFDKKTLSCLEFFEVEEV